MVPGLSFFIDSCSVRAIMKFAITCAWTVPMDGGSRQGSASLVRCQDKVNLPNLACQDIAMVQYIPMKISKTV